MRKIENYKNLPREITLQDKWVNSNKNSKVPMMVDCDKPAIIGDSSTYGSFTQAVMNIIVDWYSYLGYVFTEDDDIIGIDIDDCVVDGVINDKALEIIKYCDSYTEYSKSKTGIHILLKGKLDNVNGMNANGYEIYNSNRFFILTGDVINKKDIIPNQSAIDRYIRENLVIKDNTQQTIKKIKQTEIISPIINGKKIKLSYINKLTKGTRNVSMLSIAGHLLKLEYSLDTVKDQIIKINQCLVEPPLTKKEIDNIIRSCEKYHQRKGD